MAHNTYCRIPSKIKIKGIEINQTHFICRIFLQKHGSAFQDIEEREDWRNKVVYTIIIGDTIVTRVAREYQEVGVLTQP